MNRLNEMMIMDFLILKDPMMILDSMNNLATSCMVIKMIFDPLEKAKFSRLKLGMNIKD